MATDQDKIITAATRRQRALMTVFAVATGVAALAPQNERGLFAATNGAPATGLLASVDAPAAETGAPATSQVSPVARIASGLPDGARRSARGPLGAPRAQIIPVLANVLPPVSGGGGIGGPLEGVGVPGSGQVPAFAAGPADGPLGFSSAPSPLLALTAPGQGPVGGAGGSFAGPAADETTSSSTGGDTSTSTGGTSTSTSTGGASTSTSTGGDTSTSTGGTSTSTSTGGDTSTSTGGTSTSTSTGGDTSTSTGGTSTSTSTGGDTSTSTGGTSTSTSTGGDTSTSTGGTSTSTSTGGDTSTSTGGTSTSTSTGGDTSTSTGGTTSTSTGGMTSSGGIVSGIPEPASWGMMMLGFGLIGAALRRRARRWLGTVA